MKRLDESGVVSIISIVIFSIIFTIVAMAYVRSVSSQQKNSLDYDMSTKAYYSAESGIQDALRGIALDPVLRQLGQNTCRNGSGFIGGTGTLDGDLGYTCQIVDTSPREITGNTENVNMIRINPDTSSPSYYLQIRWSSKVEGPLTLVGRDNSRAFPATNKWTDASGERVHPLLKSALISMPSDVAGGITRNNINQFVYFMNPAVNSGGITQVNVPDIGGNNVQDVSAVVQQADCYDNSFITSQAHDGSYSCAINLLLDGDNFSGRQFYLRLSSLYGATNYRIRLTDGVGNSLAFEDTQVTVDVTGKAGDVYRRVKQTFPINNEFTTNPIPDAAIVAGDGICKQFRIGATPNLYETSCTP